MLLTPDKGKRKEDDPTSAPSSDTREPQRFAGLKDKILGSLQNEFSEGNGWDQGNEDSLFRGETNLVGPSFTFMNFPLD